MFDLLGTSLSLLSNAYSESRMKAYKVKDISLGDVCRSLKHNMEALVAEEKLLGVDTKGNVVMSHYPIYAKASSNSFETEKCGRN